MGNSAPLEPTPPCFREQVTLVESVLEGMTSRQIYRLNEPPYDLIVKHKRSFANNDMRLEGFTSILSLAKEIKHKNIATLHHIENRKQLIMCGTAQTVTSFWNYYSITLADITGKRKRDDVRFTPQQTWYILKSLIDVAVLLNQKKFPFGDYRSSNINLSAQGYIKLYILKINNGSQYVEEGSEYQRAMANLSEITEHLPLPPEFIPHLKQGNMKFTPDQSKCDSFMIGTVVLEMLMDEDVKNYYSFSNKNFLQYKKDSVSKDLKMLNSIYNQKYLITLLQKMMEDDPSNRISVQEAQKYINQNRENITMGGSVKMFDDEESGSKPKLSYRSTFDFSNNFIKSVSPKVLEMKLNACPIQTLTKRGTGQRMSNGVSMASSKYSVETKDKSLYKSKAKNNKIRGSSLRIKSGIKRV